MSASTDLCSRSDVKSYLGLTGESYDAVIDLLIPAASEAIERLCRRRFASADHTEYHDGGGKDRLVLEHRPASAVSGVWDDLDREFSSDTKLDADDFVLDSDRGLLILRTGTFADGVRNVKVTYTAGYSETPDDVTHACIMLAAAWFHRGREAADGLDARSVAEMSQRFASETMPEAVRQILLSYREHVI